MGESNRTRDVHIKRSRRVVLPYLLLLVGLAFTAIVYYYFSKLTFEQDQSRFQKTVQELHDRIRLKVETSIALLRAGTGLFAASDDVSAGEFNKFVQQFDLAENYPGIQGIGFAEVFPATKKDALVKTMRDSVKSDFRVWPDDARNEYTAIIYLQPSDIRNDQGFWTAHQIDMHDLKRNSHTILKIEKLQYDVAMKDDAFTLQALRREP
jgi:CHASE1-domain containing sensor protein